MERNHSYFFCFFFACSFAPPNEAVPYAIGYVAYRSAQPCWSFWRQLQRRGWCKIGGHCGTYCQLPPGGGLSWRIFSHWLIPIQLQGEFSILNFHSQNHMSWNCFYCLEQHSFPFHQLSIFIIQEYWGLLLATNNHYTKY